MNAVRIKTFVILMQNATILLVHSIVAVYLDTVEMGLTVQVNRIDWNVLVLHKSLY
jgi:hypothetical protein